MDIKEIGTCGVFVIGGIAFGFSQYGLNSVLSEDLKYISEVSIVERPAYMESVTTEFQDNFDSYDIQMETYVYQGNSKFTSSPENGTFIEVVSSDKPITKQERKNLRKFMGDPIFIDAFCQQDEMTMFTEKGWSYDFTVKGPNGHTLSNIRCSSTGIDKVS